MVSTFSPNIQLEEPARGDQVGVWDTPVNANMTLLDLVAGAITTISGAAGSVVLAAAQFQSKTITFNSTLLAGITITFPTSFKKSYEVYNTCTGSSAFTITLQTTVAGGQVVCCPPGEIIDVVNDGTNIRYRNFGRVGTYWDFVGSSLPNWVSGCTVPPYAICDGSAISSSVYPVFAALFGTTLPDARGRSRFALDGGAGRISSAATGFSGSSVGASGGGQATTLRSSMLPNTIPYNDPTHTHSIFGGNSATGGTGGPSASGSTVFSNGPFAQLTSNSVGITINPSSGATGTDTPFTNLPPAYIGGLTLIRVG